MISVSVFNFYYAFIMLLFNFYCGKKMNISFRQLFSKGGQTQEEI